LGVTSDSVGHDLDPDPKLHGADMEEEQKRRAAPKAAQDLGENLEFGGDASDDFTENDTRDLEEIGHGPVKVKDLRDVEEQNKEEEESKGFDDDEDKEELTEKFSTMPPHPEVRAALRKLRDAGFRLFTLTDNLLEVQTRQLGQGGILDLFERRFSAERRAGKYLADVFMVGVLRSNDFKQAKYLDPIKPILLLPEVVDESKWWRGRHYYSDPEKQYLFRYVASAQLGQISYNTQMVQPKEFVSFWDFLKPKWKGKILARDIRLPGTGGSAIRLFYYSPEMGPEFVRKLFGETDITLFRDRRQGLDWLASGKFPLCLWCEGVEKANSQGLPVDVFGRMKEGAGLSAGQAILTLVNQAPHANAAKVFINWFLSRDGQLNFQKALGKADEGAPDSLRIDIPKDDVDPKSRRIDGVKYVDTEQWQAMKTILALVEDALAQAGKK
jgi:ABC-type Fe3+ transport system substrate-binding protein